MAIPIIGRRRERRAAELKAAIESGIGKALAPAQQGAPPMTGVGGATYPVPNPSSPFNQTGGNYGADPLPRPNSDFGSLFGPGYPLFPDALDPLGPSGRAGARRYQYPVTTNIQIGQFGAPWTVLRQVASEVDVVARCIQLVQDAIGGMQWSFGFSRQIINQIRLENDEPNSAKATAIARDKYGEELTRVQKFWERPDERMGYTFSQWLNLAVWSNLVYDGIVITPSYTLGGDLHSLSLIDTSHIKILLDNQGFLPQPPAPAYQQILYGFPRSEFQAEDIDSLGNIPNGYRADQLSYYIQRPRLHTPYGFSTVEECINIATLYQQRQEWMQSEWCYDDQTEVLTDQGWKLFKNLDQTERVASRTDLGEFVWETPTAYTVNDDNDELIEFKSNSVDLLVTPNHRMLLGGLSDDNTYIVSHKTLRADETAGLSRRKRYRLAIPTTSSNWIGTPVAEKVIEHLSPDYPWRSSRFVCDMRVWSEFLGLYIAEGNTTIGGPNGRSRFDVCISQSAKSDRLPEVRRILDATPFTWHEYKSSRGIITFTAHSVALAKELKPLGYSYEKYIPQEIKNLPTNCLEAVIHGFWVGDGFRKNIGERCEVRGFATSSRVLADDLQELLQKCGIDSMIAEKDFTRWSTKNTHLGYQVVERSIPFQRLPKGKYVPYSGNVYCVSVPSGILYVRRNGRAAWCGNSHGVTPKGVIKTTGTEGWTPEQFAYFQQATNDQWSGQTQRRQQVMVLRPGMEWDQLKDFAELYKTDFEEWCVLQIGAKFGVPQQQLGIPMHSFARSGAQNQTSMDLADRYAIDALVNHLINCINDLTRRYMGSGPEITITATSGNSDDSDYQRAQADASDVNNAIRTTNEIRAERGLPLISDKEADVLRATAGNAVIFFPGQLAYQEATERAVLAGTLASAADNAATPVETDQNKSPVTAPTTPNDGAPAAPKSKSNVAETKNRSVGHVTTGSDMVTPGTDRKARASRAPSTGAPQPSSDSGSYTEKELSQFLKFAKARFNGNKSYRVFEFNHLDPANAAILNNAAYDGSLDDVQSLIADVRDNLVKTTTPVAAGLAVIAGDTGRTLMLQRALSDDDPASGDIEWPGGTLESGETSYDAACREWQEETGCELPDGQCTNNWLSPDGVYELFVYQITNESDIPINADTTFVANPDDPDGDCPEVAMWMDIADLPGNAALRSEVALVPFSTVF